MQNALIQLLAFVALGLAWRILKPAGLGADALQRPIVALIHRMLLPVFVFLVMSRLPLKAVYFRISVMVILATLGALALAWFWFNRSPLSSQTKGALVLASAFSGVIFLGMPLTKVMVGKWTMTIAVDYMLVSNMLVLFTAGLYFARGFGERHAITDFLGDMIKEPVAWGALAGLAVNLFGIGLPGWLRGLEGMLYAGLIPLLLITIGLSLSWQQSWNQTIVDIFPVAVIQLVALPLILFLLMKIFPAIGVKTSKALLINGMMPAMIWGFTICERYRLDSTSYAQAFAFTSVLALATVPLWFSILW